jgi:hypothetical protein
MRMVRNSFLVGLIGLALAVPAAWAQQQSQDQSAQPAQPVQPAQPEQPIRALQSPLASAAGNDDSQDSEQNSQALSPDTRPLAGAQDLSLGTLTGGHNFWQPQVAVTSNFESNVLGANNGGWGNWNTFIGGITLDRTTRNSNLTLSYMGGGGVSTSGNLGNSTFQQAALSEQLMWGRSTISILDSLIYLPGAAFGFAGATGIPISGGGSIGLQNGFTPAQGILTGQDQSLSNAFVTQVQTQLTRRSSLTFLGGYTLLHYVSGNFLNSDGFNFQAGYNNQITREDTLSVFYTFSAFRFGNYNQSINNNSVQVAYARRVTGRLALHVGGGPSFASFQTPISANPVSGGSSGGTGSSGGSVTGPTSQTYFAVSTGLIYKLERTTLGVTYNHGISAGSGVLAGAVSNFLIGTVSRQLTPTISAGLNVGYSRNTGLSVATIIPSTQSYDYTYVNASLSRRWGRSMTVSLSYQLQSQNSGAPPCVGAGCGTNCTGTLCSTSYVGNTVFVNLTWKPHQIAF